MDEFFLRALIGGLLIVLATGPLGVFIVWRRMAFFGDAISHAALLGVVTGLVLQINITAGIVLSSLLVTALLAWMERSGKFSSDTLLGILSHGTLAFGLVLLALTPTIRVDLNGFLFGDILAIGPQDILMAAVTAIITLLMLFFYWRPLMMLTISEEVARVEGVNSSRLRMTLMLLMALAVAVSIKIVGILLITSLLIIPAATARAFARTPTQMVFASTCIGAVAVMGGMVASLRLDTPAGPSIVVAAVMFFAFSHFLAFARTR